MLVKLAKSTIRNEWFDLLESELTGQTKLNNLLSDSNALSCISPSPPNIFRALRDNSPSNVRVVILGQDPYPTPNVAIGKAFAVSESSSIPKSLCNIFAEVTADLGKINATRTLDLWAKQGILLINRVLTVEHLAGTL